MAREDAFEEAIRSAARGLKLPPLYRDQHGVGFKLQTPLGFKVIYLTGEAVNCLGQGDEDVSDRVAAVFRFHYLAEEVADFALKWPALRRVVLWLAGRAVR